MGRAPYLKINRIPSIKSVYDLSKGIAGMAVKNIGVGNSFSVKEWTSHAAVESDIRISAKQEESQIVHYHRLPHIP